MLSLLEVQTQIVAVMKADPTLMSIVKGIWDEPPVNAPYPFISLGPHTEGAQPTFGHSNAALHFYLHVWWSDDNMDIGVSIVYRLNDLFKPPFTITTLTYTGTIQFEQTNFLQDPLRDVRHMPVRYLVYAYERV